MSNKPQPIISVIIIGYNAEKSLSLLIQSLQYQTANSDYYELIFVDDCSNDTTSTIWNNAVFNVKSKYIRHNKNKGRSASRNSGVTKVKGKYCLFTNSNIALPRRWVQGYLDFFSNNPNVIAACGLIHYTSCDKKFEKYLNRHSRGLHLLQNCANVPLENVLFANAAIRRDIFENMDGFDENFKSYGGQELEFMLRAESLYGNFVQFCENVCVTRIEHPSFTIHSKRLIKFGENSLPILLTKHSEYFKKELKLLGLLKYPSLIVLIKFMCYGGLYLYKIFPNSIIRVLLRFYAISGVLQKKNQM